MPTVKFNIEAFNFSLVGSPLLFV